MKALAFATAVSLTFSMAVSAQDLKSSSKSSNLSKQPTEAAANVDVVAIQKKIDEYTAAIKDDPKNDKYYGARGQNFLRLNQDEKALADLSMAISINPARAEYFNVRGNCLISLKRYKSAYEDFDRALEIGPRTTALYLKKGGSAFGFHEYGKAFEAAKQAVRLSPKDLDSLVLMAACEQKLGLLDQSLQHLNKALEIYPNAPSALLVRADTYTALGNKSLAAEDLKQAQRLGGHHQ